MSDGTIEDLGKVLYLSPFGILYKLFTGLNNFMDKHFSITGKE